MCVCVCVLTLLTDINVVGSVQAPRNRKLCVAWCLSSKGLQSNMRIIFTFNLYCSLHLDYIFIFQHEGITLFLCYFQFVTLFTFSMLRIPPVRILHKLQKNFLFLLLHFYGCNLWHPFYSCVLPRTVLRGFLFYKSTERHASILFTFSQSL